MSAVTGNEITDRQIRALQREAAEAGDLEMVALCRLACGDHETATQKEISAARAKCAVVISDAATEDDEENAERAPGVDADGDCVRCGHPANNSSGHGVCRAACHTRGQS
jgi:hypothetical protein